MTRTAATTIVNATEPAPFAPEYFTTVFLVPDPPREWPRRFAVVTACNPDGIVQAPDANERAARELVGELDRRSLRSFEATGASADLVHREPGRGFATDLATAATISTTFRQRAFFWIEDDVVYVCTDGSGRGWRVGRWSERVVA